MRGVDGQSLGGDVYEITTTGRRPVPGAGIYVEHVMAPETYGPIYASTLSDRSGGYFVCNIADLRAGSWLRVTKQGSRTRILTLPSASTATLDIELQPE